MDNSISSQVAEPKHHLTNRAHGWAISDRSTAQLGLFEQILNIPVTSAVSQHRTKRASEPESVEREPETVNEPQGTTEETEAFADQNGNDDAAPSDTGLAVNASFSPIQLPVAVKEQALDSSDEVASDQDLTILDPQAISETPEAAPETKLLRPQNVAATTETNEQESVQQPSNVINRFDERAGDPAQAAVGLDESSQTQSFDQQDRSDRKQIPAIDAADGKSLSDKIEPVNSATNATDLDQPQPIDVENRTTQDQAEAHQELLSQTSGKIHSEETSRREKWFEHPSKETNSDAARPFDQDSLILQNEANAIADQRDGLQTAKSTLADPQPSLRAETTPYATVENAAATAIAALASSGSGSTLASTASRAIGSASTAGGTQSAGIGATESGTSGVGAMPTNSSSKASNNTSEISSQSTETRQLSQQERVRLVQRVARSFSRLSAEGGQISLRLHPPQLGSLNVSVRIEGRSMSAKLQTETAAARDAIIENLPILRQRLAEQGIEVQQFQVEMAGNQTDTSNSSFNQSSNQSESGHGQQAHNYRVDYRRFSQAVDRPLQLNSASADRSSLATSSLDLKV